MSDNGYIRTMVEKSRAAQQQIEHYTQEQADAMVKAVGRIVFDNAETLSREGEEETGMGKVEHKLIVHQLLGWVWRYLRDKKSVGVLAEDHINRVTTLAKPVGVVGCVTPSTSPSVVPAIKVMLCLKGRNSAIIAPHPGSKKTTLHTAQLMIEALEELGAPKNLVQIIEEPSIQLTNELMAEADVVIATGGPGMVKAAYSSGKPSYGVGQGNVQVIVDTDYEDFTRLAQNSTVNRVLEYGMFCTGEQTMFIPRDKEAAILKAFEAEGNTILRDANLLPKLRELIFPDNGPINRGVVGVSAAKVAEMVGLSLPEDTPMLIFPVEKCGEDEVLCREIMFPALRYVLYDDFNEAVAMAKANFLMEGAGHAACIYSTNGDRINYTAEQLPVGRLVVEQGGGAASGGFGTGLPPTSSLGCGSWGNNSISENLSYDHLLNVTKVSHPLPQTDLPTGDDFWE